MAGRTHNEYNESVKLHRWLEVRGIKHFHCPNENYGNTWASVSGARMGVSKGVPDYFIFLPNGVNACIELKRSDGYAYASKDQKDWLAFLSSRGFRVAVCHGAEEAVDFLKSECEYEDTYQRLPFDKCPF